jgi:NADH-quinone oxidoreductase subunit E
MEVECLGACVNAPMLQIGKDFYEDLDGPIAEKLQEDLRDGRAVKPGPQNARRSSEPLGGATTLAEASLYDGSMIGHHGRGVAKPGTEAEGKAPAPKPPGAPS